LNQTTTILPPGTDTENGLSSSEASLRLKTTGYNEVAETRSKPILQFLSRFWGLTAWMLELIVLLSFLLHKYADAYIVLGLLLFNAVVGFIQEKNAAKTVEALRKKLQVTVRVLRDRTWNTLPARELVPGDIIRIRMGDFVPADIEILKGRIGVDQSALTGESLAVQKKTGDSIYSGSVITNGEATGIVQVTGANTRFGKTIELVKIAKPKPHINAIITKVMQWLLLIVGTLLAAALALALIKGIRILDILPLMLVLLLGAVPVALTAMFTVCMALGSKELVAQGVLVTRLTAPDDAASMDILFVDKTGTLTQNKLSVAHLLPADAVTANDLLTAGALASNEANHDAIDMAFILAAKAQQLLPGTFMQQSFQPFDPLTRKTTASILSGKEIFTVMKGAFTVIANDCKLDAAAISNWTTHVDEFGKEGFRTLAVARTNSGGVPRFLGIVALHDPPRADSAAMIQKISGLGITIKMLTGDALPIAREISKAVDLGESIIPASALPGSGPALVNLLEHQNGVAEVYPKNKFDIVSAYQAAGHIVGMTGDGVNDAPALKQAEVGIAVSNATDVAKGAGSIVLTQDGLTNILSPIKVGRMMFERINTWVLNKIARTILKTSFVVISFLIWGKFVMTATALLLMIFMTDFVKIALSTDRVQYAARPSRWNINGLAKIGIVLGLLMTLEAFGILYLGLEFFHLDADSGALNTYSFEILLFFAIFSIFVVREKNPFWHSRPSKTLLVLLAADAVLGILFASVGLLGFTAIPLTQTGLVLLCTALGSFLLNDAIKVQLYKRFPSFTNT
jgi:H+-transporting ATPase